MKDKPTFTQLVLSLAQAGYVQLGMIADPFSGKKIESLESARGTIGLLEVLKEKTRGNLADEEIKILEDALYDLRTAFITQKSKGNSL